jgi:hypothetical protein
METTGMALSVDAVMNASRAASASATVKGRFCTVGPRVRPMSASTRRVTPFRMLWSACPGACSRRATPRVICG